MMEQPRKRIGILTGGGDCPGLNAVIRAACSTAERYGYQVVGLYDGFEALINGKHTILDSISVSNIYLQGGTILGTTNTGHFCFPIQESCVQQAVKTYKELGLSSIICIGGDGTMSIAYRLSLAGINVVGVPKTIDNDLKSTDQTFGFDSAVAVVTEALGRLHTTACSHHRAMVVEVMGRNSGWIALAAGLAGGAKIILIPEIPWKWETLIKCIKDRANGDGPRYTLVCVSEGAKLPSGGQIGEEKATASKETDKLRLGGIGKYIADKLAEQTGVETRVTVLGHIQRGGTPTSYDRILATKFGALAAKLAIDGDYGKMVALRGTRVEAVAITPSLEEQKKVDPSDDQMVLAARMVGTIFGDEDPNSINTIEKS